MQWGNCLISERRWRLSPVILYLIVRYWFGSGCLGHRPSVCIASDSKTRQRIAVESTSPACGQCTTSEYQTEWMDSGDTEEGRGKEGGGELGRLGHHCGVRKGTSRGGTEGKWIRTGIMPIWTNDIDVWGFLEIVSVGKRPSLVLLCWRLYNLETEDGCRWGNWRNYGWGGGSWWRFNGWWHQIQDGHSSADVGKLVVLAIMFVYITSLDNSSDVITTPRHRRSSSVYILGCSIKAILRPSISCLCHGMKLILYCYNYCHLFFPSHHCLFCLFVAFTATVYTDSLISGTSFICIAARCSYYYT